MPFEHPFGVLMTGSMSAVVQDPSGITPPATIIQTDDNWNVHVTWSINGLAANFIGGTWHVAAYLESIGGSAFEAQVGATQNVPLAADLPPAPRNYTADILVAAGTVPAGAYKLVTLLTYDNGAPGEMAGFVDGPILQFYDPV